MQLRASLLLLGCLSCFGTPLAAQVLYGSLVGDISDPTGAAVAGAKIVITNRETGQIREGQADGGGHYSFQNVIPGNYEVKTTASGFQATAQSGVIISINTVTRLDFALKVGDVAEQVTVEATVGQLQTDKGDVHVELGAKEVINMPLPRYRNYQSLINLAPGATPGRYQNSPGSTPGRSLTTNVNGVNRNNNVTKIDGATSVHVWLPHHAAYVAPAETVETVNVSTSSFDAEQGMAGGAAITVVTKSGTNDFHGSAFGFHENSKLGAKNVLFKDPQTPKSLVTILGLTAGGAIIKNKLFYFGGWERTTERLNRSKLFTVPTADQRAGNFSAYRTVIYDPMTGNPDGSMRSPFAGNIIPESRQSRVARQLNALTPLPNLAGDNNNFFSTGGQNLTRNNYDLKVNWNPSVSNTWFFKYGAMRATVTGEYGLGAAGGPCSCDAGVGAANVLAQVATVGQTKVFSPTFLWDMTLSWTRTGSNSIPTDFGQNIGLDTLQIPGTNGKSERESGMPNFQINGYTDLGLPETWNPYFYGDTTYGITQNFGWVKGQHDMRFGFEGVRHWLNHWQPEVGLGPRGRFIYQQAVTGTQLPDPNNPSRLVSTATNQFNAQAAFLLGLPSTVGKTLQWSKMTGFAPQLGFYFRDRWQMSRKLTVTLGLRYELYPMMTRAGYGGIEQWDQNTNLVELGGRGDNPRDLGITTSKKMFAPRLGIAYRLNDQTVIRSGYGLSYNPMPFVRPLRGFYPLSIAQEFTGANSYLPYGQVENGIPEFTGPDLSSPAVPLPTTAQMRTIAGDSITRGYVQSWNFIVERKLPGQFITSVGYVGTNTVRSFADWDANAASPGGGNAGRPFFAPFRRTAQTWYWSGFAGANYHSLQVTLNRQFSNGLLLKGAYTWSKAINMTDDDGWAQLLFNDLNHLSRNRALAGYDMPHIFQMGFVYELPFGSSKRYATSGIPAMLLGGWQANGVFAAYSGRPFTVQADGGALNAPGNTQTADQVKMDVTKIGSADQYYDVSAFSQVTAVRFGTVGRNTVRGPGAVNLDFGLFRDFTLKEWLKMQFRAEAFNFTNTPHFNAPALNSASATVGTSSFMRLNTALDDQRTIRLGLRFQW